MSNWYLRVRATECGPFNERQLRQLTEVGLLSRDVEVFRAGQKSWLSLGEALFGEGQRSSDGSKFGHSATRKGRQRVTVDVQVRVDAGGREQSESLTVDLSDSGVLLKDSALLLEQGDEVTLTLGSLDQRALHQTRAEVVRIEPGRTSGTTYALKFVKQDVSVGAISGLFRARRAS